MKETIFSSANQCSIHQNQLYQFYCRDCKDCVCVECLPTLHRTHVFCNLADAEGEIRKEFHNYITDNQEENTKLDKTLDFLQQKIDYLEAEKIEIKQDIQNFAENMKGKIDNSKKDLISSLEAMYEENIESVLSVRDRVQKWQLIVTQVKNENVEEYSFLHVVNIVVKLRKCIKCAEDIDKILKRPILERNSTVCNIGMLVYKNDDDDTKSKSTVLSNVSVHTQTENFDDVESDVEWFNAEDSVEIEYGCENSSDELKDDYPLTITLDDDNTDIRKIVPISDQDAWVIANRNLQKIQGLVLEKEIFAKLVDDIEVLEDGSVLILNKGSKVIMKLLPNKRLIRFVAVSSVPHCLCTTANKSVLIMLHDAVGTGPRYSRTTCTNYVVEINQDGIQKSVIDFERYWEDYPFAIKENEDDFVYVLFHRGNINGYTSILNINKKAGVTLKEFRGACGMQPHQDFGCYGIFCDSGNILVSDNIHHKIYLLNKDLEFKKCIVDASHGIESPMAIAINNNLLWVSNRSKISLFKYDQYK